MTRTIITPQTKALWTRNIVRTYLATDEATRAEGAAWYREAHALATELDPADPARAAGVIAALSPRQSWTANVNGARRLYATGTAGGLVSNVVKAQRIALGAAPLDVLGGSKVRAFYSCIVTTGRTDQVCVDMHAHDIALGMVTDDATRTRNLSRAGGYDAIADSYRSAARILRKRGHDVTPATVQATTWVAWRRTRKAVAA